MNKVYFLEKTSSSVFCGFACQNLDGNSIKMPQRLHWSLKFWVLTKVQTNLFFSVFCLQLSDSMCSIGEHWWIEKTLFMVRTGLEYSRKNCSVLGTPWNDFFPRKVLEFLEIVLKFYWRVLEYWNYSFCTWGQFSYFYSKYLSYRFFNGVPEMHCVLCTDRTMYLLLEAWNFFHNEFKRSEW